MDFIISKVAMVVCALLVVLILAGVLDQSKFLDHEREVARILSEFCELVEDADAARAEAVLVWEVPMMPTGAELQMTVDGDLVRGESGGARAHVQFMCPVHTWALDNRCLNRSNVEDFDRSAPVLEAVSGQRLKVGVEACTIDGSDELLVFISCGR